MITITLTEADLMRLKAIEIDRDADEALAFVREKVLPEVKRQEGLHMKGHLDGGKGSAF